MADLPPHRQAANNFQQLLFREVELANLVIDRPRPRHHRWLFYRLQKGPSAKREQITVALTRRQTRDADAEKPAITGREPKSHSKRPVPGNIEGPAGEHREPSQCRPYLTARASGNALPISEAPLILLLPEGHEAFCMHTCSASALMLVNTV